MGWISETSEAIRAHTGTQPIACPRGWGDVAFVGSVWCVPPLWGVDRRCPIGGVSDCASCSYASNPDAFRLAEQVTELQRLRDDGTLSAAEYESRRVGVVRLAGGVPPGRWQRTTAWTLGPLGLLLLASGAAFALLVHPGFWGLAGAGAVTAVLGLSFWGMARAEEARAAG